MGFAAVVEAEVTADRCACLADRFVGSQILLLVFDGSPQAFNEDVVVLGALAVHADGDAVPDQHAGERQAGELAPLIGIEDSRLAVSGHGLFQRWEYYEDKERRQVLR